jgi:glycine cleavage system H protein
MKVPDNLLYTSHDEWVRVDGDTIVVGITDFAQDQLGELVHVELPPIGKRVKVGEVVCEVESVKAVAEIYAPASGEVVAVNEVLEDAAEQLNKDPYGSWIYKLKVDAAPSGLMDPVAYRQKIG